MIQYPKLRKEVDAAEFREGMSCLAGAVTVVTSNGPAGLAGFTATAICSVTDSPPTLLLCANKGSSQFDAVFKNGVVGINITSADQVPISQRFSISGKGDDISDRFSAGAWTTLQTGSPLLDGAVVNFDCEIVDKIDKGSHAVFFCEVRAIRLSESRSSLIYLGRQFFPLSGDDFFAGSPAQAQSTRAEPQAVRIQDRTK